MFGMGIMPMVNPTYYKNLGRGFTQSQTLDKVMDFITKPSADKKAKIISELLELQKIGVLDSDRAASIFADDIIQAVQKGKIPYIDSGLEFFGKAYSAFDVAARLTVYETNSKMVKNIFPSVSSQKLKVLAAEITNDTYQNYGRVSQIIRRLSQLGVMPQFVVFTAELTRNVFHQYRIAAAMARGTFGKQYGLSAQEIAGADKFKMQAEGLKRLTFLSGMIALGKVIPDYFNRSNGFSEEEENHFRQNVAYPYQVNKQLLLYRKPDDPNEIAVMNASYLNPLSIPTAALEGLFADAFDENSPRSFFGMFAEEFIGEGTFLAKNVYNVLANRDQYGKEITLAQEAEQRMFDMTTYVLQETFEPGFMRELIGDSSKLAQARRGGKFTVNEVIARQFGFRFDKINQIDSLSFKLQDLANTSSDLKQNYTRAYNQVLDGRISQEEAMQVHARSNADLQKAHDRIRDMYKSTLLYGNMTKEETSKTFTDARANLSTDTKIRVINDMEYSPIPLVPILTNQEEYDQLFGQDTEIENYSFKEIIKEISKYRTSDPMKYRRLISRYRASKKASLRKDISDTEKLLLKSSSRKRAELIRQLGLNSKEDRKRLRKIGVLTNDTLLYLKFEQ